MREAAVTIMCAGLLLIQGFIAFGKLGIVGVDVTEFPKVRISVVAEMGVPIDLRTVRVKDNGKEVAVEVKKLRELEEKQKAVFAIVFDITGSMGDEIEGLKEELEGFVERVGSAGIDAKVGVVTFRDEIVDVLEPTGDLERVKKLISGLRALGGGDTPELAYDALWRAFDFKAPEGAVKVAILVTDAPSHYRGDGSGYARQTLVDVVRKAKGKGWTVFVVGPPRDEYKRLSAETGGLFFDIHGSSDFAKILKAIGALFSSEFIVSYVCPDPSPGKVHRVEISLRMGRASVSAVSTYVAPMAPVDVSSLVRKLEALEASQISLKAELASMEREVELIRKTCCRGSSLGKLPSELEKLKRRVEALEREIEDLRKVWVGDVRELRARAEKLELRVNRLEELVESENLSAGTEGGEKPGSVSFLICLFGILALFAVLGILGLSLEE